MSEKEPRWWRNPGRYIVGADPAGGLVQPFVLTSTQKTLLDRLASNTLTFRSRYFEQDFFGNLYSYRTLPSLCSRLSDWAIFRPYPLSVWAERYARPRA